MLAKLLKHEFRATGRLLLPVYAVLLATTLLVRLTTGIQHIYDLGTRTSLFGIFAAFLIMLYTALQTAVFVITAVLLIQRFYKNLLRDEGYLMHTLPVPTHTLITAKLLPAIFWCIIAGLAALLSMSFAITPYAVPSPAELFEIFLRQNSANRLLFFEGTALVLFTLAQQILQVYLALIIGHLANSFRLIWSVVTYIGISLISSYLTIIPLTLARFSALAEHLITEVLHMANSPMIIAHAALLFSLAIAMIFTTLYFTIINWLMKHKLNLE